MAKLGYEAGDIPAIVDHLVDCELRGVSYGGLARAVSITERIGRTGLPSRPIAVTHESPVSARIDGADHIGYIVGQRATDMAIEKASAMGLSAVGADDTWYTGMLSYFAEQAAAHDLVTMIASTPRPGLRRTAPRKGGSAPTRSASAFFAGPSESVWDIGTSTIMHAEVLLARRQGLPLPEGRAFGPDGQPTTDPDAALAGAFTSWAVTRAPGSASWCRCWACWPARTASRRTSPASAWSSWPSARTFSATPDGFKQRIADYAESVRTARPADPASPVRMPFDRSWAVREAARGLRRVRGGRGHCRAPAGLRRLGEPPLRG